MIDKSGTVEFNTDTFRHRRPAWLVLLKLVGVAAMIAVGAAIAIPTLVEFTFPLWHAIATTAGLESLLDAHLPSPCRREAPRPSLNVTRRALLRTPLGRYGSRRPSGRTGSTP